MKCMIHIAGSDKNSLSNATAAICAVIKAGGTEAVAVAAVNALVALCKAPEHTSISNCHFENKPAPRARRARRKES